MKYKAVAEGTLAPTVCIENVASLAQILLRYIMVRPLISTGLHWCNWEQNLAFESQIISCLQIDDVLVGFVEESLS